MIQNLFQLTDKSVRGKAQGLFFKVKDYPGKMFSRLDIHVFVIAVEGQLRPEGDVKGHGQF